MHLRWGAVVGPTVLVSALLSGCGGGSGPPVTWSNGQWVDLNVSELEPCYLRASDLGVAYSPKEFEVLPQRLAPDANEILLALPQCDLESQRKALVQFGDWNASRDWLWEAAGAYERAEQLGDEEGSQRVGLYRAFLADLDMTPLKSVLHDVGDDELLYVPLDD